MFISERPGDTFFYNPETGHYYEFVRLESGTATATWDVNDDGQYSWFEARDAAQSMSLFGQSGYLVTITSELENDFIAEKTDAADIWIGGARRDISTFNSEPANPGLIFEWKTGPEIGTAFSLQTEATSRGATSINGEFNSWAFSEEIEPNNYQFDFEDEWVENYVVTNWMGSIGEWNDLPNEALYPGLEVTGFLVEYGGTGELAFEYAEVNHTLSLTRGSSQTGTQSLADTGFLRETLHGGIALGILGVAGGAALIVLVLRRRSRS